MRAWQVVGSFGVENLRAGDIRERPLEPGEARLAVCATALNYRDLMMVRGEYDPRLPLPFVPCSDAAARVIELAEHSAEIATGDRVLVSVATDWIRGPMPPRTHRRMLGGPLAGTLTTQLIVPTAALVRVPSSLNDEQACTLPCAGVTAFAALFDYGKAAPGDVVVTQGSGGVALFALQLARAAGIRVIATTRSREKASRLYELGASEVIDSRQTPNWGRRVRDLTGGRGADHVIEVGGGGTLEQSLLAVRDGGSIAVIGVLGGTRTPLDVRPLLMRAIRLQGVLVGSRDTLAALVRCVEVTGLTPVVDRAFDFGEAPAALEHLQSQKHVGKVIVRSP